MDINDISRLVKIQLMQQGTIEQATGRLVLTETAVDAAVVAIGADLGNRISRPVVTITRQDVLQAAAFAGYAMDTVKMESGVEMVVPVDADGQDIFEKVHKLSDFFVRIMLDRMPEVNLRKEGA